MNWRIHLAYLTLIVAATLGSYFYVSQKVEQWKANAAASAAGFERAESAKDLSRLQAVLTDKESRLGDALVKLSKLGTLTVTHVVTTPKVDVVPEQVLQPSDRPGNRTPCLDWQDDDHRFYFHQKARTLDVDQRFSSDVAALVMSDGRIRVQTQLFELSPKTGRVLKEFDISEKTVSMPTPPRPRLFFSLGTYWLSDGTLSPSFSASYRLFGGLSASASLSRYPSLWVGWTWSPHSKQVIPQDSPPSTQ